MNFAVVEFVEDSSVEVVPSNWLTGDDICLWPPYRALRFASAVKKRASKFMDKKLGQSTRHLWLALLILYLIRRGIHPVNNWHTILNIIISKYFC